MVPSTRLHRIMREKTDESSSTYSTRALSPVSAATAPSPGRGWSRGHETTTRRRRMRPPPPRVGPARRSPPRPYSPSPGRPRPPEATILPSWPHRRRSPPSSPARAGPRPVSRFHDPWPLFEPGSRADGSNRQHDASASVAPTIGSAPIVSPPTASTSHSSASSSSTPRRSGLHPLPKGLICGRRRNNAKCAARQRECAPFERIPLHQLD